MRITLITYGTRGDVQPILALSYALQERGHDVTLLGPGNAQAWSKQAGVPFRPLPLDVQEMFAREAAQRMLANGNISAFFKWLANEELAYRVPMRDAVIDACQNADAIVGHVLMEDRAAAVAASRKVPLLPVYFFPIVPSAKFPTPFITNTNLGPWLNRFTHKLLIDMLWKSSRDDVGELRASLGLPRVTETFTLAAQRIKTPCALAYSEALSGRPSDYTPNNVITGNIVAPAALRARLGETGLPKELEAWLDRGPPPVFLGFGSMPILNVPEIIAMARAMLKTLGLRAVIGAGWSDVPAGGDDTLIAVGNVDHTALFERCCAAVHHGGAGTTYASLRAGIPTLVCSVFADQPYWGYRAKALGVGATFPFKKLNEKRLTEGVRTLIDPAVRARAQALGERLRREDGLARVIDMIERDLPQAPIPN